MALANIWYLGVKELRSLGRDPMMLVLIIYAFTRTQLPQHCVMRWRRRFR